MTDTRLNTRAASIALALRVKGLVGLSAPTTTAASDDGKWSVTFPSDWFPRGLNPDDVVFVSLGAFNTTAEPAPPEFLLGDGPPMLKVN